MCMALMFALYPTCKAIIIHASWQSQALSLLHLQLFALGYDMTTVDLFSFTYRSLSPSFSVFLYSRLYRIWILLFDNLENLLPLSLCDTSASLICSAVFHITLTTGWYKYVLMLNMLAHRFVK